MTSKLQSFLSVVSVLVVSGFSNAKMLLNKKGVCKEERTVI